MANRPVARLDADGQKIVLEIVDESTGIRATGTASVEIGLSALTGTNKTVTLREFKFQDKDNDCADMKCWVLMSEPEADS